MLLGGDEFRRTQRGNNNAYGQDNATSWVDWSLCHRHEEIVRFTRHVLALRRAHPVLRREAFYGGDEIAWFAPDGQAPDWFDRRQKRLACLIRGQDGPDLYVMFNADAEPLAFVLPRPGPWRVAADTALPSPRDASAPGEEPDLTEPTLYPMGARSAAVLVARGEVGPRGARGR
jgi:glycogen operon protein